MKALLGGALAGVAVAILVLAVGATVAAFVVIAVALLTIVVGCVDYVRSPRRRRGHG
ncbi:hypothetical protein SEA_AVOCADO_39 [Mycobacterium phage Avocado]|uniref:Uncharacterized protein n=1 Tax=Mycobacterium phage Avocado TaxID=2024302 RepID=A0A222YZL5_9CAUD|nr:hypothetical protein KDW73_gp39 [Mycobacterium phage Avocado]ASR77240.1 hypothetical protein SEA_AVOCADO_39 [Mycobacterium phage Avocado]